MTTTPKARVTQADREAAASAYYAWIGPNPVIPRKMTAGDADGHSMVQAFAAHRTAAIEGAAKFCDTRARWHEEAFRKEVILKNDDRQTHFAARHHEADELAQAIRALTPHRETQGAEHG